MIWSGKSMLYDKAPALTLAAFVVPMAVKRDGGISSVWGTSIEQLRPGAHDEKREGET